MATNASDASTAYQVVLTHTADKAQRKLDKPLRQLVLQSLQRLSLEPERCGEQLSQPLSSLYSHHLKYKGLEFRIAYKILHDSASVIVLLIGPHENFYKKLKNLVYAA
jgi:mRNA-degrading endonuclease RelE of RelBE toxin-antitoxin system